VSKRPGSLRLSLGGGIHGRGEIEATEGVNQAYIGRASRAPMRVCLATSRQT